MPTVTTPLTSPLFSSTSKMEDRKRSAVGSADDLGPPNKRLAVNGSKLARDDTPEMKEESWIEAYTKGAIFRQMQEYNRKAITAESRLDEIQKKSTHHDDHLRIIDAWWKQVLDEIELLADASAPTKKCEGPPFLSSVSFKDLQEFHNFLEEKGKSIKSRAESLLQILAAQRGEIKPETAALEAKITRLLAAQKEYFFKLDRLNSEKDTLSEQLNTATLRYFKAEKKLDRAKSMQVQKLEQQAFANATRPPSVSKEACEQAASSNGAGAAELLLKYEETAAAATKQKEQLDNLLAELKTLQEENSSLKFKREASSDEDFIRTDVFKLFKGQNEDLIKRVNNLEATNKQLREEAEKLQGERSAFRAQLEADATQLTQELEADIVSRDQDLARVRSARDELLAENMQRKASMEQERASTEQMKELVSAKEDRITALESEIVRLRPSADESSEDVSSIPEDELRRKYAKLEKDFKAINQELPAIEKAFKKMRDLAQKKVMDFTALEDRVQLLIAEKSKADQKYFAARKDADTRNNEIRSLRHQNGKSAEIIAQLKELESQNRSLLGNLEKQMADLRVTNATLAVDNKKLETVSLDGTRRVESLNKQITDLSNLVKSRDSSAATVKERSTMQEVEVEKLKVRVEHAHRDRDNWRSKALSNSSEEEEMLRTFALCSICRNNFKNTALKTCGHLFCSKCVDDRISNRMRKCPSCSRAFDKMDVMPVHH